MGTVTKPNNFTANTTIQSSQVNANFDTIYNEFNGSITNANISASAGIAESKLSFNTSTGHNHNGVNSRAVASGTLTGNTSGGGVTTSSGSYVDVTNATVTLAPTSTGDVLIVASGTLYNNTTGTQNFVAIYRDGNELAYVQIDVPPISGGANNRHAFSITYVDQDIAAGSYVYKLKTKTGGSGTVTIETARISTVLQQ